MPHRGGVIRTYRHRRVVKRRQKIGPDVIDFRSSLPQGVYDVSDEFTVKLTKAPPDGIRRQDFTADPHGGGRTAQYVHNQLQKALYIIVGKLLL